MKISIVTGCYNHSKQLPKLLKSLEKQNDFFHEWLICDDGSPEKETQELLYLYEKLPKVKVFRQENKGMRLSKSLNNGLKQATGDLIFIIMGDTYLEDDTLKQLSDSYITDTAGSGLRKHVTLDGEFHSWEWRYSKDFYLQKVFLTGARKFASLTGNSMIISKKHLEKIGYWPEEYEGYGRDDWAVFLRLQKIGVPLVMYNNIVVNHIYHGEGGGDNPKNVDLFMKEYEEYKNANSS